MSSRRLRVRCGAVALQSGFGTRALGECGLASLDLGEVETNYRHLQCALEGVRRLVYADAGATLWTFNQWLSYFQHEGHFSAQEWAQWILSFAEQPTQFGYNAQQWAAYYASFSIAAWAYWLHNHGRSPWSVNEWQAWLSSPEGSWSALEWAQWTCGP